MSTSLMNEHEGRIRAAAVLNLLLPGVPSIYYGQEVGVTGQTREWGFDANHIPVREAFPWTPEPNTKGTAVFYKNTGPWWDQSYFLNGGAQRFALSKQQDDPESVWNLYRQLIGLRKQYAPFRYGTYQPLLTNTPGAMAFGRQWQDEKVVVLMNLSGDPMTVEKREISDLEPKTVFSEKMNQADNQITLAPYGIGIFQTSEMQ